MIRIRLRTLLTVLLLTVCAWIPASADSNIRFTWNSGRKYLLLPDLARFYGMALRTDGTTVRMYSKYSKVEFDTVKRTGSVNGIRMTWLFPVLLKNGKAYLSDLDFRYALDPVLRPKAAPGRKVSTVMIDPGHGGKDKGATGVNGRPEKDAALAIARLLRTELRKKGISVRMTRTGDSFPSLDNRVEQFNRLSPKPDLFISIHCNAAADRSIDGIETFAVTPPNAPSSADASPLDKTYAGNRFDACNTRLAYAIQKSLAEANSGTADRGVKHARFYVIRNVNCPAVLIETGFLTNRSDCARIFSARGQETAATAIADGILKYASGR